MSLIVNAEQVDDGFLRYTCLDSGLRHSVRLCMMVVGGVSRGDVPQLIPYWVWLGKKMKPSTLRRGCGCLFDKWSTCVRDVWRTIHIEV
jgi:hypothetical protein